MFNQNITCVDVEQTAVKSDAESSLLSVPITENLLDIPDEVWTNVLSRLTPGELFQTVRVNKQMSKLTWSHDVSRFKLTTYFPDEIKKHPQSQNYCNLFKTSYLSRYSDVWEGDKKWISLIYEGDTHKIGNNISNLMRLIKRNAGRVLDPIKRNQRMADHLFEAIYYYMTKQGLRNTDLDPITGYSCLHWLAVLSPTHDLIDALIPDLRADQDNYDQSGYTPLAIAVKHGQVQACMYFLSHGANIELASNRDDFSTPFYLAVQEGQVEVVKLLHQFGANTQVQLGNLPILHIATQNRHVDVVATLISLGFDIDAHDSDGATSLYLAAQEGYADIVELLLSAGANPRCFFMGGYDALYIAAQRGHDDVIENLLKPRGCHKKIPFNIDLVSPNGSTALYVASQNGHVGCVTKLVAAGADSLIPFDTYFPAYIAARKGYLDVLRVLLPALSNINQQAALGATCIYVAAQYNHVEIIRLLLEWGADPAVRFNNGYTALHIAVVDNKFEAVQVLAEHRPDLLEMKDNNDMTPLDLSKRERSDNITAFLESSRRTVPQRAGV